MKIKEKFKIPAHIVEIHKELGSPSLVELIESGLYAAPETPKGKIYDWITSGEYNQTAMVLYITFGEAYVEIEKQEEQKYYVLSKNKRLLLFKVDFNNAIHEMTSFLPFYDVSKTMLKQYELTEKEIKNFDERYWPFAVKKEEVKPY